MNHLPCPDASDAGDPCPAPASALRRRALGALAAPWLAALGGCAAFDYRAAGAR